jgi:hypothetical protein
MGRWHVKPGLKIQQALLNAIGLQLTIKWKGEYHESKKLL